MRKPRPTEAIGSRFFDALCGDEHTRPGKSGYYQEDESENTEHSYDYPRVPFRSERPCAAREQPAEKVYYKQQHETKHAVDRYFDYHAETYKFSARQYADYDKNGQDDGKHHYEYPPLIRKRPDYAVPPAPCAFGARFDFV